MGIVYRAEDEKLRRTVALKVLPDAFAADEERRRRFLREARSAAALRHPNIATIHDVGEDAGRVFLAMELVEGPTLRERMASGRLRVSEVVRIARGIARGLARAHAKGIVHRDLKPDNVILDAEADGEPKILDFGLAKLREERSPLAGTLAEHGETASLLTEEGRLLGTPHYMSPEQAGSAGGLDARSDVFALGVLLYEMLAGRRPFEADRLGELLARIERDPPASLRSLAPEVPEALEAIVNRCLAKKPADRYADAGSLAAALEAIVVSADASEPKGTLASPRSLVGSEVTHPRAGPARRNLWLASLAGAALVATAGVLAWRTRAPSAQPAAASSSAASTGADAAVHGIAMTDHPPPKTAVPEAAAAYAAGLQHWRDGETVYASFDFLRACKLDPTMAAADLRAAILPSPDSAVIAARECYAAALQHRAALDDRDRALLRLAEAAWSDPPVPPGEGEARARAVASQFPEDAEVQAVAALFLQGAGQHEDARSAFRRAFALDPLFAGALWGLSNSSGRQESRDILDRCIELSPTAGSCIRSRLLGNMHSGRCAEAETDARRLAVVEPDGPRTFETLAVILAARNAPVEAVRDALAKRAALQPDDRSRRRAQVQNDAWLSALVGDLDAAEKAARAWDDLYSDSLVANDHEAPLTYLLDVLDEEGDRSKQVAAADSIERRVKGWTGDTLLGLRLRAAYTRYHAGAIDEPTFRRQAEQLEREIGADWGPSGWCELSDSAATPAEAAEALARLPDAQADWHLNDLFRAAWVGHIYLLAGQPRAALPHLRDGAASCTALPNDTTARAYTIWWMREHVELGEALEQTGDPAGACDAYRVVLDRWKNAKPRSVSLEKAKERSKALACSK